MFSTNTKLSQLPQVPQTSKPMHSNRTVLSMLVVPSTHSTSLSYAGLRAEEHELKVESKISPNVPPLGKSAKATVHGGTYPPPKEIKPLSHNAKYWFFPVHLNTFACVPLSDESVILYKKLSELSTSNDTNWPLYSRFSRSVVATFYFLDPLIQVDAKAAVSGILDYQDVARVGRRVGVSIDKSVHCC